jgi:hypothetical protein
VRIRADHLGGFVTGLAKVTWWNSFHQVCSRPPALFRLGSKLLLDL